MGAVPMVKLNMKPIQVLRAPSCNARHELFGQNALTLRLQHDRCAMSIISANKMHFVPLHPHCSYPRIGLDVLHHMADMKWAIGIGKGSRNEEAARHVNGAFRSPR